MPSYKLTYFNARGRAEVSRLLFTLAGVNFEDKRVEFSEWAAVKPNTPFGSLPVLEVDGKTYAQSIGIAIYLAKEFGFFGQTNLEALEIMQVVFLTQDIFQKQVKFVFEKDAALKASLESQFKETDLPTFLKHLEKLLKANGQSSFFVGKSITLADLAAWDFLYTISKANPGVYDAFPAVKEMCHHVANNPKIKAYVEKRASLPW